jgi:hypothetical protein
MQSQEAISQDDLRKELCNMIKAELKQDVQFLKASPIRRVPPKDLSQDEAWIEGRLKLAKWLQLISRIVIGVIVVGLLLAQFFSDELPLISAKSLILMFLGIMAVVSLYYRWNKIESLLKILNKVRSA